MNETFVVLVKGLGQTWTEGDVVSADNFRSHITGFVDGKEVKGVDVNRLLATKAIRHATEHEKTEKKVTFKDTMRPSHHHDINQQTEVITHLRQRVADLEQQIAAKNLTVLSTVPNKPIVEKLREKDAKIEQLQLQMKEMMKDIKELRKAELVEAN